MGIKELKVLKEELVNKLKSSLAELISGPEIGVAISDDLERIIVTLLTNKQNKEAISTTITENLLIYNTKDKNNLVFQGSGKNIFYKNNAINGYSSDHGQIDLTTLFMLQQFLFNFCLENDLLESEELKQTDAELGGNQSEE